VAGALSRRSGRNAQCGTIRRVSDTAKPTRDRYFTLRGTSLKRWTAFHLWVYRRTRGRLLYKMRGMPTLLLTTTGRKSGVPRTVPLPYLPDGDGKVVVGSFAGGPRHPAWALNLFADPTAQVQDRGERYAATGEVLSGDRRALVWERLTAAHPWYADYQARTSRELPLVRLTRAGV
jgi:deazaflavin-dependent oxidoreductase (nitroreductase family)